jgi:UDP-N-acetylmuramyl pentapeptide phosphotransferase/UDP-N-acetylglucosamine-1-phosphate transferase
VIGFDSRLFRMSLFTVSFFCALAVTLLIVRSGARHGRLSADHDLSGPQKFHARPVPRIGGLAVLMALLAGAVAAQFARTRDVHLLWLLLATAMPAFLSGLAEDLTKNVSPRRRLVFTVFSAAIAIWLLDAVIVRTAIPGVDLLMTWAPFAALLTIFVVTGVANAINIIDGFNGLAAMCVLMMLLGLAYVAFQVGDTLVFSAALIAAGAVLGFFVWNFPAGLIFLGDGGAYLLGFLLAELAVLLLHRNPQVSPMFALLLCSYPVFETIFTMYRRKIVRGTAAAAPDAIHLHTLIHRRVVRWLVGANEERRLTARNSMTSPYLWLLCSISIMPAVLWWNNTAVLSFFLLGFMLLYMLLYRSIVRFKTPRWLISRR